MSMSFKLVSNYQPSGHQPQAIKKLVSGIKNGNQYQTLLGVTGSGKTFTIANLIQQTQLPTLIISHNKTLAGQLYQEFKSLFPKNKISYFVSYYDYYQPEAYMPSTDTYIAKEVDINDLIDKLRLEATSNIFSGNDNIV
ncbi:DEAD/DEAH box helicase family protein, partial [Patescibacteria group bacterium]|nr:DEAD/DEAH box helicase family protein [Patescibacteria group bacterium]